MLKRMHWWRGRKIKHQSPQYLQTLSLDFGGKLNPLCILDPKEQHSPKLRLSRSLTTISRILEVYNGYLASLNIFKFYQQLTSQIIIVLKNPSSYLEELVFFL